MNAGSLSPLLRFESFEVNIEIGELRRYGHRVKLQAKPFQILVALLEHPGELVSRGQLQQRLWSNDTFVDFDHNLNNAMDKLRKALNDSAEQPKFIETLPRRGYRFIAPINRPIIPPLGAVEEIVRPLRIERVESSSGLASAFAPRIVPCQPAQVVGDSPRPQPPNSKKKLVIALALCGSLLLVIVLGSAQFFGFTKLLARAEYGKGPESKPFVIEKNGAVEPSEEGFKLFSIGHFEDSVMRNALNQGYDRWTITSNDQAYYYRALTDAEKSFASKHDWNLTCVCAVKEGLVFANIDFGKRFDIELLQEGDKYYVALPNQLSPKMEWEQKIEFPGVGDSDRLHTYELRFDHLTQTASLWIDGGHMASGYHGHAQFVKDRGLFFGTSVYLSAKTGIGVFRSVRFEVH